MADDSEILAQRRRNPVREPLQRTGLYHSVALPDGRVLEGASSLETLHGRVAAYRIPERLDGQRVLDIGPWDGFFTFEMERRGAEVVGIDYQDYDTFREVHRRLGSRAQYLRLDVYELDPQAHGVFNIVLCLGVLYHTKHPLLVLERLCAITTEVCIIDTYAADVVAWSEGARPPIPYIEFYEHDQLAGMTDNWCGPSVSAVEALARAAGFARTEVLGTLAVNVQVAAYRKWGELPPSDEPGLGQVQLHCHSHGGRCFDSRKEEYIVLWCGWDAPTPPIDTVFPEVDEWGVAPLSCAGGYYCLSINVRIPPGLGPGRHTARLKIGRSGWSERVEFFLDLPPIQNELILAGLQDALDWKLGEVHWETGGWLSLWVTGLSEEADRGNTVVEIAGIPHFASEVIPATGQVNVKLRPMLQPGESSVRVLHRGAVSNTLPLTITGEPPDCLRPPAPAP